MPKKETIEIQQYLVNLGKKLGFHSKAEYTKQVTNDYNPKYDVIWFLNMDEYNLSPLNKLIDNNNRDSLTSPVPIAVFEIEGSTTSSKNQIGNLLNMSLMNSYLNFVIVNNEKASSEKDTYRRGVKICRTYMEFSGNNNFIFLDWEYLKNIELSIDFNLINNNKGNESKEISKKRSKVGGEKDRVLMNRIIELLLMTKISLYQNYTPPALEWQYSRMEKLRSIEICKKKYDYQMYRKFIFNPVKNIEKEVKRKSDIYYFPKIDFALVLQLPILFKSFLLAISKRLQQQVFYYPLLNYLEMYPNEELFFPFIGIEVESSINKHLNGGIFNMSRFFYLGFLVSNKLGQQHLNTLANLGVNNVQLIDEETIKGVR